MRAVQGKGGDLDVEAFAVPGFHVIAARHDARRRRQRHVADVFKRIAGLKARLLADHTRTTYLVEFSTRVGYAPMAASQLHRFCAKIFDHDVIGPDKMASFRRRLVVEIGRVDTH